MLEAYKVGVTLEMNGNVLTNVERLIAAMEALDRRTRDAGSAFGRLASDVRAIGSAGRGIGQLSAAMERLERTNGGRAVADLDKMAAATRAIVTASERLTGVLRDNARLTAEMSNSAAAAARAARTAPPAAGRPTVPPGSTGGTAHRAGRFTSHDGLTLGLGASMVGAPILHGAEGAFERGMEVAHLRTQILADRRVTPAQADLMVTRAYDATASAPGTKVGENLHALIDLKNVTGSLEEAEAMLPRFARLTALLKVMDKRRGGDGAFAAAKAMEIMGGMIDEHTDASGHTTREINPALLQERLDKMARVSVATNARVSPQDYLAFAKQARVAGMTLSDEFIYEKLPAIMLALGGPRTGTALMSMAQVFEGGKLTNKSYDAMAEIGLAGPAREWMGKDPVTGRRKKMREQPGIYDIEMMRHDPLEWMKKAQERMEAAGIHGSENQIVALMKASQRSTIAGFMADLLKDMPAILKEQQNIINTRPDVADHFAKLDPAAKLQQMQAAFDKLMTTLGGAAMDDAVKLMDSVTGGLNRLAEFGRDHPTMSRVLVDTATGLGALAVGLGTLSTAIFLLAPALKLLGIAGGATAGAASAAAVPAAAGAAGAAGAAVRTGLGVTGIALGTGAAVVGTALVVGSEYETEQTRRQQEELARLRRFDPMQTPSDGFWVDGRVSKGLGVEDGPTQRAGDRSRVDGRPLTDRPIELPPINLNLKVEGKVDGQTLLTIVSRELVRKGSVAGGTTGYDVRVGVVGGIGGLQ